MITDKWKKIIDTVDFAFQPIISIKQGTVLGYESLLRDFQKAGFNTVDEFFDTAYEERVLFSVDIELRKKALIKIRSTYEKNKDIVLFYNLDNRIIEMDDYSTGHTATLLKELDYENDFIVFEVSEKHEFESYIKAKTILNLYMEQGFHVALDDFGTGYSGLKTLYNLNPHYIKIDRFFITDIVNHPKKRLYVTNIINIAHQSGIKVIAEGIETLEELYACEEIGCNYLQGYYIQKPTTKIKNLKNRYLQDITLNNINFNNNFNLYDVYYTSNIYNELIDKYIISSAADINGMITSVSDAFCRISGYSRDELIGKPHNIVRHKDMSGSLFKDLWETISLSNTWEGEIKNRTKDGSFYWVEVKIMPNYNKKGEVSGYTSIRTDITDRKRLEELVNIDYLTNAYNKKHFDFMMKKVLSDSSNQKRDISLALFDLDNFKAYNDTYGHKKGDVALIKVVKAIQKTLNNNQLLFRIGGEEFAILFKDKNKKESSDLINRVIKEINSLKIEHKNNKNVAKILTVSCGVICTKLENIKQNTNLFVNADILLYKAKNNGKNRVVVSNKLYNSSLNIEL